MFPQNTIDVNLELKVIGFIIMNFETYAKDFISKLQPHDFSHTVNRKIFQDLKAGTIFSYEKLIQFGLSEKNALIIYETDIYSTTAMDAAVNQIRILGRARKKFYESSLICQKIASATESGLKDIVGDCIIRDQTYTASKARENAKKIIPPNPVYFDPKSICEEIEYFSPGWVAGIGASTGVGKTSAAIQISRSISQAENSTALYVSLEMPLADYLERALTIQFYESPDHDWISWQRFRKNLTGEILSHAVSDNEIIIDKPNLTVTEIREQAEKLISRGINLKTIVIDHFHILTPEVKKADENAVHANTIMLLDEMAKALNVRILCLFQTKKKQGDNRYEEPFESDISGAKAIVNQLWWLLMLWRSKENQDAINWKIAKRRGGKGVGNSGQIAVRGTYMFDSAINEPWYA